MNTLKRQFESLSRLKAPAEWKQETRNRLIADIRFSSFNHAKSSRISAFIPVLSVSKTFLNPFAWMQSGAVLMLIIMIALGGSVASVGATFGSVPGDVLYPVKRTIEHVQIALSPSDEDKAKIHLDLVSRRVEEFYVLTERIQQNQENDKTFGNVEKALEEVEKQVKTAQTAVLKVKDSTLDQKKKDTIARALSQNTAHIEGVIDQAVNTLSQKGENALGKKAVQVQQNVHQSELSKVETVASLVQDKVLLLTVLEPKKLVLVSKFTDAIQYIEAASLSDDSFEQLHAEERALSALKSGKILNTAPVRKAFGLPENPLDETVKDSAFVILGKQDSARELIKKLTALQEAIKTEESVEQLIEVGKNIEQGVQEAKILTYDLTRFAKALGEEAASEEDQSSTDSGTIDTGVVKGITVPVKDGSKDNPVVSKPVENEKTPQESPKIDKKTPQDKPKEQEPFTQPENQNDKPQEPVPPAI